MRHIKRFPKPEILEKKAVEWTNHFVASDKKRPDNSKYAHAEIRTQLNSMSFHKCFYCETILEEGTGEIDHYVEVTERRDLAYEWENLNLTCQNCNKKVPNTSIAVTDALNPCLHTDEEIEQHLTFIDEVIKAKNNSLLGLNTIQKFRLDKANHLRSRQLHHFKDRLLEIQENQIKDGGRKMTEEEMQKLKVFAQADYSFSLMFRLLLKKHHIL